MLIMLGPILAGNRVVNQIEVFALTELIFQCSRVRQ